ncbi:YicC/YloC family endoribonuclease [Actibacterium ureilyticum]|uniref:YicC/YloC family endoribonuclease n=1 Tax=Actibacterium ureilyticum TaxID=1590614 RepID=UPI001FE422FD|nr:YicC/YloC family endoribonuclease [Actibacterium ureilyticum]
MTGYATQQGGAAEFSWTWELRSVNAKGLDLRLRLPDWLPGLEQAVRAELSRTIARGNVSLSLKLTREASGGAARIDPALLQATLRALKEIEAAARAQDLTLAPASAMDIHAVRGMMEGGASDDDAAALAQTLLGELPGLIDGFNQMRAGEGAALNAVLADQLGQVDRCVTAARTEAEARKADWARTLRDNLQRVLQNSDGADSARVEQELALIAVKADVTEELDRLGAHVGAARDLLAAKGPVGRKLDFLMQEFNREANTLCAKAQSNALTRIGLDLKAVIDQMREQVQNVE